MPKQQSWSRWAQNKIQDKINAGKASEQLMDVAKDIASLPCTVRKPK